MGRPTKILVGQKFSHLTVLEKAEDYITPQGQHRTRWLCECDCSNHTKTIVHADYLLNNKDEEKSCGCVKRNRIIQQNKNGHKTNKYDTETYEYGVGWTSNTNTEFYFDIEDYDLIKDYCWFETASGGYHSLLAHIQNGESQIKMSALLGFKNYDHINRNPLDNRKKNFREATHSENCQNRGKRKDNTSGITGVAFNKWNNKWAAYVSINKKLKHLGYFENKGDAIITRLKAEKEFYGEFSPQKHLFEEWGV